jgi:hypothetical protein
MAEVGLLPFARIALQVAKAVLPRYRSRFSKTSIHPTPVAGHSMPDALRRLDLSRGRGATGRAPRVAPDLGSVERTRLHHSVSFLAALGRYHHRPRRRRDGAPVAWSRKKEPEAGSRGCGCDRLGTGSCQHLFCEKDASSRAKAAAVAALVEVGCRGGFGPAVSVVAEGATRSVERLRQSASCRAGCFRANAHRTGVGRCRVRQRKKSYLYPAAARGTECHPGQAWEENLAYPRSACADAPVVPATVVSSPRSDRERILVGRAPGRSLCMQMRQALLLGLSFNLYRLRHRYLFLRMSTEPDSIMPHDQDYVRR